MGTKSNIPILVTGSHRSGTTWVGKTISKHPRVRYIQEPFNVAFPNDTMGLKLEYWFTDANLSSQKNEIIMSFGNLLKKSPTKYAFEICKARGMDLRTPSRFAKHLLLEWLYNRILVKDPIALLSAGWLYELYNFKVICMIRNPLAFVGSLKVARWDFDFENLLRQDGLVKGRLSKFSDRIESIRKEGTTSDFIDRASLLWNILHFTILEYKKLYPSWLFLKHEDISYNPRAGFQEVFGYLGLDMNSDIWSYVDEYTSETNPIEATSEAYQSRNSKLLLHTWQKRLSDDEIYRIRESTSEIALQFYRDIV